MPIYKFKLQRFIDNEKLSPKEENINPNTTGLIVDYMTRVLLKEDPAKIFERLIRRTRNDPKIRFQIEKSLNKIKDLSSESIQNMAILVTYDEHREDPENAKNIVNELYLNSVTLSHIKKMVRRCLKVFQEYGPITACGFRVDHISRTRTNKSKRREIDFLSKDSIWELKTWCASNDIDNTVTQQVLEYYMLGLLANLKEFKTITNLRIFNARTNELYTCPVSLIVPKIKDLIAINELGWKNYKREVPEELISISNINWKTTNIKNIPFEKGSTLWILKFLIPAILIIFVIVIALVTR